MKRKLTVLGCSAVMLLVLGALVPALHAQKPLTIRLGVHTSIMGAGDVIALRQNYFKEAGLDVEARKFALGKEGRDAMIAGAIDINATAPTPFMIGLDKKIPYTAIAVNSYICGASHVVVLKSSDINNVAQLKGKKVGVPKGTITEYVFLTRIAPAHGLKEGDFGVANIPDPKDMTPSLVAKAVDAATLGEPHTAVGEQAGVLRVLEDFCKYDPLPFLVTATNKAIHDKPEAVVAYLRGWNRAIKLLRDEPGKAAAIYAEEQKSMGRDVDVAIIEKAIRRMKWEPEITPQLEKYLNEQAKDLTTGAGEGRLKAVPDVGKALNKDLMKKAMAAR